MAVLGATLPRQGRAEFQLGLRHARFAAFAFLIAWKKMGFFDRPRTSQQTHDGRYVMRVVPQATPCNRGTRQRQPLVL